LRRLGRETRLILNAVADLEKLGIRVRDDRLCLRGKRKERTSGIWRAGRTRRPIANKTYMETHEFGERTAQQAP